MTIRSIGFGIIFLLTWLCAARATVFYVDVNSINPTPPYTNWSTASTDIQSAIDVAGNGDTILVNDGIYQTGGRAASGSLLTNRVVIGQSVTVQSVNGPAVTIIQGYQQNGAIAGSNAVRCVYMTNNAVLAGFTLAGGSTTPADANGGGIWCQTVSSDLISNCLITANTAFGQGGGTYQGILVNCVLSGNTSCDYSNASSYSLPVPCGGGASQSSLIHCTISGNSVKTLYNQGINPSGGGTYGGTASNCLFIFNSCSAQPTVRGVSYGSAAYGGAAYNTSVANCVISSNSCFAVDCFGGGIYGGVAMDSAIIDNIALSSFPSLSGFGGGAYNSNLTNCTIVNNFASDVGGGTYNANEVNCINYFNVCPNPNAYTNAVNAHGGSASYCCSTPLLSGSNNISLDPLLASVFYPSTNSPCRGAGSSVAASGTDINGEPWGNPPSIGCEEIYPGSLNGTLSVSIAPDFTNLPPGYAKKFQANISGPLAASVWNFGDGTLATNEPYISHAYAATGNYTISLTGYNNTYPTGQTATLNITVAVPTLYYVAIDSPDSTPPYSSWFTAATNIQDAIDLAPPGSLVLVTNGDSWEFPAAGNISSNGVAIYRFGGHTIYGVSNRVAIYKPITVESVKGPQWTWIYGAGVNGNVRGVYMTNGATLIGFTVTNCGTTDGGGIWSESTNDLVTNCIISGCHATEGGGGYSGIFYDCILFRNAASDGGGAAGCLLNSCILSNNTASYGGGAFMCQSTNCLFARNGAGPSDYSLAGYGGGAMGGTLVNCTFIGNFATNYGGGVFGGFITNCTFTANSAGSGGAAGGGNTQGAGVYQAILNNCIITSNSASSGGGVANGQNYSSDPTNCTLINCSLIANNGVNNGGGAYLAYLTNCIILSNSAGFYGGGVEGGILNTCLVAGNYARGSGGGMDGSQAYLFMSNNCIFSNNAAYSGGGATGCNLNYCLIISNSAIGNVGYGGGVEYGTANDCLIIGNLATNHNSNGSASYNATLNNSTVVGNIGISNSGAIYHGIVNNCIVYDNIWGNYYQDGTGLLQVYYSCTYPLITNYIGNFSYLRGFNNISNEPNFVNLAAGDFYLQPNSLCINSGDNAYVTNATDLDGNPRIVGGTVDMGAYEYQTPSSILSYAWAQQYGLPTDGSADYLDLDGTGMKNWQKSIAGLNPTNPASTLVMLPSAATNNAAGVTVSWQSVNTRMYYLQRATDLTTQPAFSAIQSNLVGQAGTTSFTDITATNAGPYLYRVGVQ